jgi:MoaA/NifB/PqqE/SkfB family radical SAM enzyme
MPPNKEHWINIDEQGHLVLPPEVVEHFGIRPGTQLLLKECSKSISLQRPITQLAKVYIEPTSRCNLTCRTCIRNTWEEPQGDMTPGTFDRLVANIRELPSRPDIFFGGFGEPLLLENIVEMVKLAKEVAGKVGLITNGLLLTEERAQGLIDSGLDTLWVSVDGVTPESYADIRIGAALPQVLENILHLAIMRHETNRRPEIGISFVAMRRNIADLPVLIRKGSQLGVSRFMITNAFPYTEEMCREMLYVHSVDGVDSIPSPWTPSIELPRIDLNEITQNAVFQTLRNRQNVHWNGATLGQERGSCPFIESGSVVVCWDGNVSSCLALMHSYPTYLNKQKRNVRRYILGNLENQDLKSIWDAPDYVAFRKRVQEFDFSPCTWCGGCEMAEKNEEDCFSNPFPTCGGCLWAQGVIQCP